MYLGDGPRPGKAAGLVENDTIATVDGQPASDEALAASGTHRLVVWSDRRGVRTLTLAERDPPGELRNQAAHGEAAPPPVDGLCDRLLTLPSRECIGCSRPQELCTSSPLPRPALARDSDRMALDSLRA
jgi:hypothetical protein